MGALIWHYYSSLFRKKIRISSYFLIVLHFDSSNKYLCSASKTSYTFMIAAIEKTSNNVHYFQYPCVNVPGALIIKCINL